MYPITCNTNLTMGEEGSTVHTKRPLSQPTTNTEPDSGLKIKDRKIFTGYYWLPNYTNGVSKNGKK